MRSLLGNIRAVFAMGADFFRRYFLPLHGESEEVEAEESEPFRPWWKEKDAWEHSPPSEPDPNEATSTELENDPDFPAIDTTSQTTEQANDVYELPVPGSEESVPEQAAEDMPTLVTPTEPTVSRGSQYRSTAPDSAADEADASNPFS